MASFLYIRRSHVRKAVTAFAFALVSFTQVSKLIAGSMPVMRYSDVWCSDNNESLIGHFDMTYLNSDLSSGSQVTVIYGFDLSEIDPYTGRASVIGQWMENGEIDLRQWEEFGWMTRISKLITKRHSRQFISGIRFLLKIRNVDGSIVYGTPEYETVKPFKHFYSPIPDMRTCKDLGHERLKVCAMETFVENNP